MAIEKPFGTDLASARALNRRILKHLDEPQIYRIGHFLGKETVRNVMVTRFANGVFEPLWNRNHIDHVQITAAETVGVEERGDYYDHAGALRDMIPNHLFQLLAMTAMEAPNTLDAAAISAERTRVIEAVQIPSRAEALADAVRGQYRPGTVLGRPTVDYRREPRAARRPAQPHRDLRRPEAPFWHPCGHDRRGDTARGTTTGKPDPKILGS